MFNFLVELFSPNPINDVLAPPFGEMPLQKVKEMVGTEAKITAEIVERCALGENYVGYKLTQAKAIGSYKKAEHKALVGIVKENESVKLSAKKHRQEYRELTKSRGFWG